MNLTYRSTPLYAYKLKQYRSLTKPNTDRLSYDIINSKFNKNDYIQCYHITPIQYKFILFRLILVEQFLFCNILHF